jgi:hypothetical protein
LHIYGIRGTIIVKFPGNNAFCVVEKLKGKILKEEIKNKIMKRGKNEKQSIKYN